MKRLLEKGEVVRETDYRLNRLHTGEHSVTKIDKDNKLDASLIGLTITVPGALVFREEFNKEQSTTVLVTVEIK